LATFPRQNRRSAAVRADFAVELLEDIKRSDAQLKESHRRLRTEIKLSDTTLTDVYGIGPIIAAMLIGYSGDVTRFADADQLRGLQRHRTRRVLLRRSHRAPPISTR